MRIQPKVAPDSNLYPRYPVSPTFYVGQKPYIGKDGKLKFKKIRLIVDERERNKYSPMEEHMSLPSHREISKVLAYALSGKNTPYQQLK